jgi:hypothetical protein
MAKPTSRATLVDYALRQLGAPVIKINLASEQIDDALDDAIQLYQEYNSEAIVDHYRKHQITQTDIDNQYITIPENMIGVSRVMPFNTAVGGKFSAMWQIQFEAIGDLYNATDLKNYDANMRHLALIEHMFTVEQNIEFSRKQGRLYMNGVDWSSLKVGDYLVFEGKQTVDPDTFPLIYNDIFLKRYFTALLKKQWGANLKKFEGIQMPGGVTLDGRALYEEAITELQEIVEKMREEFEEPISEVYVG